MILATVTTAINAAKSRNRLGEVSCFVEEIEYDEAATVAGLGFGSGVATGAVVPGVTAGIVVACSELFGRALAFGFR